MFTPSVRLYRIDQVPDHFREQFIISGYRHPRSSLKQCVRSIFEPTNETANFWTHFLPAVVFMRELYLMSRELDFVSDPYTYPMLAYLLSTCLFPTTSSLAHILNTMSDRARHICFFVDYLGISVYSLGVAIAYRAYSFPESLLGTLFADIFLIVAVVNTVCALFMSCETRFMRSGLWQKVFRVAAFCVPYLFDSLPLAYHIVVADDGGGSLHLHKLQFVFAFAACALYTSHIPERFSPGRFDIVGHSHQLFHICSGVASYFQILGIKHDLKARRGHLVANRHVLSFGMSIALIGGATLLGLTVLWAYSNRLDRVMSAEKRRTSTKKPAAILDGKTDAEMVRRRVVDSKNIRH